MNCISFGSEHVKIPQKSFNLENNISEIVTSQMFIKGELLSHSGYLSPILV